jgi:protein phosphatase
MVVVESSGLTDVGKRRKKNEDALFIDDDMGLYIVADGMGGHQAGEVASDLVITTLRDYLKQLGRNHGTENLDIVDASLSIEANRLLNGIQLANWSIHQAARKSRTYRGMGSTVSAAYLTDRTLIAANVGDSPIYLIHGGAIEQISVTHNVVTEQSALDPGAADHLGDDVKYLLTRAMGVEDSVEPDICELPVFEGDALVISSDGLSDLVAPQEIYRIVSKRTPDLACRQLVELANSRGGHDNVTVIVLRVNRFLRKGRLAGWAARIGKRFNQLVDLLTRRVGRAAVLDGIGSPGRG